MTSSGSDSGVRGAAVGLLVLALATVLAGCADAVAGPTTSLPGSTVKPVVGHPAPDSSTSTPHLVSHRRHGTTTTTTLSRPTTTARGLVAGRVTIMGDSVTVDAQPDLEQDIKGAQVDAVVGEQWYQGVEQAHELRSKGRLGAVVVVALGTNGPVSSGDFAEMMQALAGVSRVVFVTDHVPTRYWQDANNKVIEHGAGRYENVVVADWAALAVHHPKWFYSDEVHMPIGGAGAQALAALVASKV